MNYFRRLFSGRCLICSIMTFLFPSLSFSETLPSFPLAEIVLIDVRSLGEYESGHAEGAIHISHEDISGMIADSVPDQSTPIALYCRSGRRAAIALEKLKQAGYSNVINLGGLADAEKWLAAMKERDEHAAEPTPGP